MTDDTSLHRFSAFVDLTPDERAAIGKMIGPASSFDAGRTIRSEGDPADRLFFLHDGWVISGIRHPEGARQVLKVHRSGDIMGTPSLPFETAVDSLVALTSARVSTIPLDKLGHLFAAHPRVAAVLFLACQEEQVTLMDRLAVSGQLGAKHSVAALLLLLFDGRPPSDGPDAKLNIPLTQAQIGEVLGVSTVHINRTMSDLETEGLIKREGHHNHIYELPDVTQLRRFVGMSMRVRRSDPSWLPLAPSCPPPPTSPAAPTPAPARSASPAA